MQFNSEELSEIIFQLESGEPIQMEMNDYLDLIDVLKAQRRIQQQVEDELLLSDLR